MLLLKYTLCVLLGMVLVLGMFGVAALRKPIAGRTPAQFAMQQRGVLVCNVLLLVLLALIILLPTPCA